MGSLYCLRSAYLSIIIINELVDTIDQGRVLNLNLRTEIQKCNEESIKRDNSKGIAYSLCQENLRKEKKEKKGKEELYDYISKRHNEQPKV